MEDMGGATVVPQGALVPLVPFLRDVQRQVTSRTGLYYRPKEEYLWVELSNTASALPPGHDSTSMDKPPSIEKQSVQTESTRSTGQSSDESESSAGSTSSGSDSDSDSSTSATPSLLRREMVRAPSTPSSKSFEADIEALEDEFDPTRTAKLELLRATEEGGRVLQALAGSAMDWFTRLKRRRRHPGLKAHERIYREAREAERHRIVEYHREQRRKQRQAEEARAKVVEVNYAVVERKQRVEAAMEGYLARHSRWQAGTVHRLNLTHAAMLKKHREQEEAERQQRAKVEEGERIRRNQVKPVEEAAEVVQTAHVRSVMRRAGVVAALSRPGPLEEAEPVVTATFVTLRPTAGSSKMVIGKMARRDNSLDAYFNVDLQRYRNVRVIKGQALLPKGGIMLGHLIGKGECGQLATLDLASCALGRVGLEALVRAFSKCPAVNLQILDLRSNEITGRAVMTLVEKAIKCGSLPALEHLDLRANLVGNAGASALAGAMMTEELKGLKRLLLQNNEVRDQGARALFLACTMDPPRYCPSLESLNLRLNHISAQQMRNMRPAPAYLQF